MPEIPVVGISAGEQDARWGSAWSARALLLPSAYLRAVESSGGLAVVLPPAPGPADVVIRRLDALILTGGADVDPAHYGRERHPETRVADPSRDRFELDLARAAGRLGLPLLAVCRGIQVLNVARGGTLHQHLPDLVGTGEHAPVPAGYGSHPVRIEPASLLGRVMNGAAGAVVPTHHHQAVDGIGTGLRATAWAEDGTVEALEDPGEPFVLGIQWHPEQGSDRALFRGLVEAAVRRMPGPGPG